MCSFVVHHSGFVIHRPHQWSKAKGQFMNELEGTGWTSDPEDAVAKEQLSGGGASSGAGGFNIVSATNHWFLRQLQDRNYRCVPKQLFLSLLCASTRPLMPTDHLPCMPCLTPHQCGYASSTTNISYEAWRTACTELLCAGSHIAVAPDSQLSQLLTRHL